MSDWVIDVMGGHEQTHRNMATRRVRHQQLEMLYDLIGSILEDASSLSDADADHIGSMLAAIDTTVFHQLPRNPLPDSDEDVRHGPRGCVLRGGQYMMRYGNGVGLYSSRFLDEKLITDNQCLQLCPDETECPARLQVEEDLLEMRKQLMKPAETRKETT